MPRNKKEAVAICGLAGKTARAALRNLLQGAKVEKKKAKLALDHINGCDFCKMRIKNAIADARRGKKKKNYLESLPETLQEARKLIN